MSRIDRRLIKTEQFKDFSDQLDRENGAVNFREFFRDIAFEPGFKHEENELFEFYQEKFRSIKVGDVIGENMEVAECLGIGGEGAVFKVFHRSLSEQFQNPNKSVSQAKFERIKLYNPIRWRTCDLASDHPTTQIGKCCKTKVPFAKGDFIPGTSLAQTIETDGSLDPLIATRIVKQLAEGLQKKWNEVKQQYQKGVIHGDIKPSNILLTPDGRALTIDTFHLFSGTNVENGSRCYMPPEFFENGMLRNDAQYSPVSDVFALGVVLVQSIAGERFPSLDGFQNMSAQQIVANHEKYLHGLDNTFDFNTLTSRFNVPKPIAKAILKALDFNPSKRHQSYEELAKSLDMAINKSERKLVPKVTALTSTYLTAASLLGLVAVVAFINPWNGGRVLEPEDLQVVQPERLAKTLIEDYGCGLRIADQKGKDNILDPSKISKFSEVVFVDFPLGANKTQIREIAQLLKNSKVVGIGLSDTECDDESIKELVKLKPDLQHIELDRAKVTDDGVEAILRLLGLRGIQLDGTSITDAAVANFRNGMFEAKLSNTAITDRSVEKLKTIRSLSHIFLTGTKISPDGAEELRQALPNCTIVY